MAPRAKQLAAKPEDPSLIPGTVVEGENSFLQVELSSYLYTRLVVSSPT